MRGKTLDDSTANKIKNAAREVFLAKGYDGATMQAIADRAGFNKAQLHYYYRSKDALFYLIFKEEMLSFIRTNGPILADPTTSLRAKLEAWIDAEAAFMASIPALPVFIISEIHRNPEAINRFFQEVRIPDVVERILGSERRPDMAGTSISLEELMTMVISLVIFPIVARPLLSSLLKLDADRWAQVQARQLALAKELLDKYLY